MKTSYHYTSDNF